MHPEIDRHASLGSVIHRWDPRWKLAGLFFLAASFGIERWGFARGPNWEQDLPPALAAMVLSLALLTASRLPPPFVVRKLLGLSWLFAVVLVLFPLVHGGRTVSVGPVSLSTDGLLLALLLILRASAVFVTLAVAFATSRFDVTVKALRRLRMPASLVQVFLFAYRYIFVFADQVRRMGVALRARGFRPACNRLTMRVTGNGLGVLLVASVERTERIRAAMKARGFAGTFRTYEELRAGPRDAALFALSVALAVGLLAWRLT
jgi:cobalt/nickel transport system permease protein